MSMDCFYILLGFLALSMFLLAYMAYGYSLYWQPQFIFGFWLLLGLVTEDQISRNHYTIAIHMKRLLFWPKEIKHIYHP